MAPLMWVLLAVVATVLLSFIHAVTPRRHWASTGRPGLAMAKRRSLSRRVAMLRRDENRDRRGSGTAPR